MRDGKRERESEYDRVRARILVISLQPPISGGPDSYSLCEESWRMLSCLGYIL